MTIFKRAFKAFETFWEALSNNDFVKQCTTEFLMDFTFNSIIYKWRLEIIRTWTVKSIKARSNLCKLRTLTVTQWTGLNFRIGKRLKLPLRITQALYSLKGSVQLHQFPKISPILRNMLNFLLPTTALNISYNLMLSYENNALKYMPQAICWTRFIADSL